MFPVWNTGCGSCGRYNKFHWRIKAKQYGNWWITRWQSSGINGVLCWRCCCSPNERPLKPLKSGRVHALFIWNKCWIWWVFKGFESAWKFFRSFTIARVAENSGNEWSLFLRVLNFDAWYMLMFFVYFSIFFSRKIKVDFKWLIFFKTFTFFSKKPRNCPKMTHNSISAWIYQKRSGMAKWV